MVTLPRLVPAPKIDSRSDDELLRRAREFYEVMQRRRTIRDFSNRPVPLEVIATVKQPQRRECEECVKTGDEWVHLRTCQQCGVTLCCDTSPNRHATKHAHQSGHPVIASAQPGERCLYCYPDDSFAEY